MAVLRSAVIVLFIGGIGALAALGVVYLASGRNLGRTGYLGLPGAVTAIVVLTVQALAPIVARLPPAVWPYTVASYYLAMSHFVNARSPYAFFWTPAWVYPVGALTLLLPVGAILSLGGAWCAHRNSPRLALSLATIGALAGLAYVAGSAYAGVEGWNGIPV